MRSIVGRRGLRLGLVSVALLAICAGVGYATIPDGDHVFTACKLNATGTIRLINPSLGSTSLSGEAGSRMSPARWTSFR